MKKLWALSLIMLILSSAPLLTGCQTAGEGLEEAGEEVKELGDE
jgi:hypothetical protein